MAIVWTQKFGYDKGRRIKRSYNKEVIDNEIKRQQSERYKEVKKKRVGVVRS